MATLNEIKAVKRRHSAHLLQLPGVIGVDIKINKSGKASLTVHLDTKSDEIRQALPNNLEGYPVQYVYTGPVRKL